MFRRLLICTDLCDGLQRLVKMIDPLAKLGLQHLVFVHCVPLWDEGEIPHEDEKRLQLAREMLAPALTHGRSDIEVEVEIISGPPQDLVPAIAERHQAEALLLGASTRNFLTEKLFGSTMSAIAQRCNLPIFTLRPPLIQVYRNEELNLRCQNLFRELLVPFDTAASGDCLVEHLQRILDQHPVHTIERCWLVAIVANESRRLPNEHKIREAEIHLKTLSETLQTHNVLVETEVAEGDNIQSLVNLGINHDISAICVTYNWGEGLLDWSIPNFGKEVLRRSWHPVLLFPPTP